LLARRKQKNGFLSKINELDVEDHDEETNKIEDLFGNVPLKKRSNSINKYEKRKNDIRFASPQFKLNHKRAKRGKTSVPSKFKSGKGKPTYNSMGKQVDHDVAEFWQHEIDKQKQVNEEEDSNKFRFNLKKMSEGENHFSTP
jgi:hypothetical protein